MEKGSAGGGRGPLEDVFLGLELAMGGVTETFVRSCGWDGSQRWLVRTRHEIT